MSARHASCFQPSSNHVTIPLATVTLSLFLLSQLFGLTSLHRVKYDYFSEAPGRGVETAAPGRFSGKSFHIGDERELIAYANAFKLKTEATRQSLPSWILDGYVNEPPCNSTCQKLLDRTVKERESKARDALDRHCGSMETAHGGGKMIIAVAGWPQDDTAQKFKKGDEITQSVSTMLESLVKFSDTRVDVLFITNAQGVEPLLKVWKTLNNDRQNSHVNLQMRLVDIYEVLNETITKFEYGLRTPGIFRLWQLPKLWVGELVPSYFQRGLLVDIDVRFNSKISTIYNSWDLSLQRAKVDDHSNCLAFGAVPEIGNTIKDHVDFQDVADRYINSGVLLVDFDQLARINFYDDFLDVGIYQRSEPRRPNPKGQWPPEQWIYNAIFAHFKELMYPVHRRWNLNCLHLANAREEEFANISYSLEDFQRDKKNAFIHHYCGDDSLSDYDY